MTALAVTDHDTVLGIDSVKEASGRFHIPYVPGAEFTALESGVKFHVLGYGIDTANPSLQSYSRDFLDTMNLRSLQQIHMLKQNGIDISEEEFFQKAGPGPLYWVKMLDVLSDHGLLPSKKIMRCLLYTSIERSHLAVVDPGAFPRIHGTLPAIFPRLLVSAV